MTEQTLIERQIALESQAVDLGAERYRKARPMPWRGEGQPTAEEEVNLPPGRALLKQLVGNLSSHIENVMEASSKGQAGGRMKAMPMLHLMKPEQVAYLTARGVVNASIRHFSLKNVGREIAETMKDHLNYDAIKRNEPAFFKSLMKANKKAGNYGVTWRRKIRRAMKTVERLLVNWSVNDAVQIGVKCVEMLVESAPDLFTIERLPNVRTGRRELHVCPTPKLVEWLENQHARCELLNPVHMPMIVPPKNWTTPYDGGYLNNRVWMVRGVSKDELARLAETSMPAVYDSLNVIQATRWRINKGVLNVARQVWEAGSSIGGLPLREDIPTPPRPLDIDTNMGALADWKRKAVAVYAENGRMKSRRIAMSQVLWTAEMFEDEGAIYYPHNLDFRGRVYPVVNGGPSPQGDDVQKALLMFAEGKPLGSDGADWLAIHIANLFGVDKVPFDERIAWVKEHDALIADSGENPLDGARLWTQADSPYCALAACIEWAGYRKQGASFVSHIPIALDGSNSGLQHFSAMLRDREGASCVNLVPSVKPADIYSQAAASVQKVADTTDEEAGIVWAGGKVIRRIAKRPVMTYCYSATRFGMQEMILQELTKLDLELQAQGKDPHLGGYSNYDAASWLSHRMYSAIGEVVSAATEAMEWLKKAARLLGEAGKPIRWTSPIGFPVLQDYQTQGSSHVQVILNGQIVKFRQEYSSGVIDTNGQVSAVAPNFVHSCDASHLMRVAQACHQEGIGSLAVIHDSFGTHACDTAKMSMLLRETLVEQYTPDILGGLRTDILHQLPFTKQPELPPSPKLGDLSLDDIRAAHYAFA